MPERTLFDALSNPADPAALRSALRENLPWPGIRLGAMGHSIVAQNHKGDSTAPTGISNETNGEITWARLTNPVFWWHVVYDAGRGYADARSFYGMNTGFGGELTAECLTRVPEMISKRPNLVYLAIGTNDIAQVVEPVSYDTIVANIEEICSQLVEAGIIVILATVHPRSTATWGADTTARNKYNRVNSWIRRVAARMDGVYIHDAAKYLTNLSSADGEPITGVLKSDDIHLTPKGAYLSGVKLGELIGKIFPGPILGNSGAADDAYDAADNPDGNLLTGRRMLGTGGTVGAGVTGSVATGWTLARTTGSTVTCVASKETDPDLGDVQVMTFTLPGGGASNDVFMLTGAATTGPVENDWVQGGCHIDVGATPNLVSCEILMRNAIATGHAAYAFRQDNYSYPFPEVDFAGPIITEPFPVPATPGAWTWRLEMRFPAANTGTVVIKAADAFLKRIDDPRPVWE